MPHPKRNTPKIMHRAGELRKELTPAERKLWSRVRNGQLGATFRRQHAIGNFIVDFCVLKEKLVVELDGSQHLEPAIPVLGKYKGRFGNAFVNIAHSAASKLR